MNVTLKDTTEKNFPTVLLVLLFQLYGGYYVGLLLLEAFK